MLTISGLSKTYANGVRALDNVSLSIGKGMFGLLGPNGAGKSTLMRIVATLQAADTGVVTFEDRDIAKHPQFLRRQLGYLPQEFGVYPKISAVDLLDHLAVLKGILDADQREQQVLSLLQKTNLFQARKKAVGSFSGGMRQRFGIAQALLGDPRLIIVDEPTAGLDPEERKRFLNLLSEIGENVVVLLSTHIVEDVRDLCPKMAILARGGIVLEGEPNQLVAELEGRLWRAAATKTDLADYKTRHHIVSTHLFAGETRVHVLADERPGPEFEPMKPSLEDVYFAALHAQGTV